MKLSLQSFSVNYKADYYLITRAYTTFKGCSGLSFTFCWSKTKQRIMVFLLLLALLIINISWRARRASRKNFEKKNRILFSLTLSLYKKIQPNRFSRLAGYRQHVYIYECLVLLLNQSRYSQSIISYRQYCIDIQGRAPATYPCTLGLQWIRSGLNFFMTQCVMCMPDM